MSEVKVNKISPRSGTDVTLGDSGDTFTVPAGASIVNNGTATGFGATGAVNWDTTAKTTGFTAVSGNGYFCNTTSGAFTVTLPATPSAGDIVGLVDYAGTFDTNALTIDGNGEDIEGSAIDKLLTGEREGVTLTYVDSTQGWIATSGINEGTDALEPADISVDFLVIAGGGGGNFNGGGGGGAGGYRTSAGPSGGGASAESALTLSLATNYTTTVGAGGSAGIGGYTATNGSNSVFSTITSIGGGKTATSGGSGGGGVYPAGSAAGAGTANQGFAGGIYAPGAIRGGGGGAGEAGNTDGQGEGGDGVASSITGTSITRAGGGGGGSFSGTSGGGGDGGGGTGGTNPGNNATAGTVNTGSGGGGGSTGAVGYDGAAGGSGIVIIKYPDSVTISNPGGGLTFTTATAGGFSVTSFTAGTGNIQFN